MGGSLENFILARNFQSRSKSRIFLIFGPSGIFGGSRVSARGYFFGIFCGNSGSGRLGALQQVVGAFSTKKFMFMFFFFFPLETNLACPWEGVRLPQASRKSLDFPGSSPDFPGNSPKGGRRKGGRGRKLSHFSFCCAFRCCVVYSPCFPVWGEEKVMTIYDAGPLAAGPLCGLLIDMVKADLTTTGAKGARSRKSPAQHLL